MPIYVKPAGNYAVVLQGLLERVNQTITVNIEDHGGDEEWFHIESADLEDSDLFAQLKLHWSRLVGIHSRSFALIHCQGGPDAGVWIHFFDEGPEEYAPGCHRLASW